jgi:hypothetical protein
MSSDAKTVPMNPVIQPNEVGEWQPRGGAYFTGPALVVFGLLLFVGGATIGLLSFATLKIHKPQLVQSLCDERVMVCQ